MRARSLAVIFTILLASGHLLGQTPPPEREETDEGCPEQRIHEYLERHGDYGRIDPGILLETTRQEQKSRQATRFRASAITGEVWRSIGPTNGAGRATALALHPSVNGTAIIGAAGGGAWKTTDSGQNWRALTDDIPNLSVGAITYAPSDPNIVYLGTGEGGYAGDFIPGIGLLMSADGGEAWTLPSTVLAPQFYKILVSTTTPKEILAATNNGLYRSVTGHDGQWQLVIASTPLSTGPGYGDVTELVRDPSNALTIYAATWDRRNWCTRTPNQCNAQVRFGSPTILKSTDGGATWAPAATGLPVSTTSLRVNRLSLAIAPSSPQTLYVATSILDNDASKEVSHIYKTIDGGATWTETNLANTTASSLNTYMGTQAWYDNTIVVSPTDPNAVIAGGVTYVRTTDGGVTWTRVLSGVHVDVHELRYDSSGLLWIANDGGIWQTSDNGGSSVERNRGLVTRQFYDLANDPVNRNRVYGGQQDNGTSFRSDAGGTSWSVLSGGDGFACAVNPNAPAIAFSTIQNGVVMRTVTAGSLFRIADKSPSYDSSETKPFYSSVMVDPVNPSTVYTASYRVWKSTTGGDSWLPLSTKLTGPGQWFADAYIRTLAISATDPKVIMVGTASPRRRVYGTTDGGANWSDVTNNLPSGRTILHVEIDPRDSQHVFVALAGQIGPSVYVTSDGGSTWQQRSNGLPTFSTQTVRFDPTDSNTVYAGTDVGVYRSIDSGATWERFGSGMPAVSVYDVDPVRDGTILRAATHGRGIWELDIPNPPNNAPTVAINSPGTPALTVAKGSTGLFTGTIADIDGDAFSALWSFPDTWTSVPAQSGVTVKHKFDRAGRYPVGLSATDWRGGVGAATVEIDVLEPGDTCATPIEIPTDGPFPYSVSVSTDLAGKESNDPRQVSSCYPFTPQTSIWLTFTPPESGDYQFSLCGSEVPAVLVGFTGSCGAFELNGLCIARSSSTADCSSSLSTKTMALNAGGNTRLFVSNYFSNGFGNVTVTVTKSSALSTIVTSVAPAVGPPGTAVVIDGIGFQSGATVTIGGVPAQNVTVVSPTIISATVPPSAAAGANLSVQNPDGTSAMLANGFTVVPAAAEPKRRAVRR